MLRIPRLDPDLEGTARSCDDIPDRCDKCPLYKSRCYGCVETGRREPGSSFCRQGGCQTYCNTCGGADDASAVPTICCKAPHLKAVFPDLPKWGVKGALNDLQNYHKVEPIVFKHKGINMNQGSAGSVVPQPYPPETECVAVSLRHIWTPTNGFVAGDLKRHMKIPDNVKLLVVTTMKDDVLEDLWAQGMNGGESFRAVNIDYWTPLMFSNYHTKGNMSNFYDALRTYRSLKAGSGHFVPLVWSASFMHEDFVIEATSSVKNCYMNAQFLASEDHIKGNLSIALYYDRLIHPDCTFYIGGPSSARVILTYKRFMPHRNIHFVSVNPWMSAFRGKIYTTAGTVEKDYKVSREQLIWHNQRNFFKLCNADVSAAPLTQEETQWLETIYNHAERNAQKLGLTVRPK